MADQLTEIIVNAVSVFANFMLDYVFSLSVFHPFFSFINIGVFFSFSKFCFLLFYDFGVLLTVAAPLSSLPLIVLSLTSE